MNIKYREIVLGISVIIICLSIWYIMQQGKDIGSKAVLSYADGKKREIPLNKNAIYDYESNGLSIHIQVKDGRAKFVNSECPDHLCEHYGWLNKEEQLAICLPAKASLTIKE